MVRFASAGDSRRAAVARGSRLLTLAIVALVLAARSSAQVAPAKPSEPQLPPGSEGPLGNDCFVPVDDVALTAFADGDAALERARAARPAGSVGALNTGDRERFLAEAFDAWRSAVARDDALGASVWAEGQREERRLSEGVEFALARRLARLSHDELDAWFARFEGGSLAELANAGLDARRLAATARGYPATTGGTRAALVLADLALERGHAGRAAAWLERARASLRSTPTTNGATSRDALAAAIEARASVTGAARSRPGGRGVAPSSEAWRTATTIVAGEASLFAATGRVRTGAVRRPDIGVRPGLAFLAESHPDGRTAFVVQEARSILVLEATRDGALATRSFFAPEVVLPGFRLRTDAVLANRPPGWRLAPTEANGVLYVVHGRAQSEDDSNALIAMRAPDGEGLTIFGEEGRPTLEWAVVGALHVAADGTIATIDELDELVSPEFQPGPVVSGSLVLAQVREYAGEVRAWIVAFERATGRFAWKRLVATGADLLLEMGRAMPSSNARLAAEPLLATATGPPGVFVSTNLGAGGLFDAVDGRPVWTLRSRRRDARDAGWFGDAPRLAGAAGDAILWAPFDSDRLYALAAGPLPLESGTLESLFVRPPIARDESESVLGGPIDAIVVQGRAGRERTVSELGPVGTDRIDALYLDPGEEFPGRGIASAGRVLVASNRGLYLFDRERELYLLAYAPLGALAKGSSGGDVYASHDLVVVVGRDAVWTFRVR